METRLLWSPAMRAIQTRADRQRTSPVRQAQRGELLTFEIGEPRLDSLELASQDTDVRFELLRKLRALDLSLDPLRRSVPLPTSDLEVVEPDPTCLLTLLILTDRLRFAGDGLPRIGRVPRHSSQESRAVGRHEARATATHSRPQRCRPWTGMRATKKRRPEPKPRPPSQPCGRSLSSHHAITASTAISASTRAWSSSQITQPCLRGRCSSPSGPSPAPPA
jgi:hypothetical protein